MTTSAREHFDAVVSRERIIQAPSRNLMVRSNLRRKPYLLRSVRISQAPSRNPNCRLGIRRMGGIVAISQAPSRIFMLIQEI